MILDYFDSYHNLWAGDHNDENDEALVKWAESNNLDLFFAANNGAKSSQADGIMTFITAVDWYYYTMSKS